MQPGTRLGVYEIVGSLGAGGMGEVYRARDTRLNREVAIKVLPALFASDPDRLARFAREAQVLASLNHPNIAAIYGIEENALVMELVEGEDLSVQIARAPRPLPEALAIARQIADALETAHEQGIVHRDLKPANIKVRADGTVKVLDFGLAKAMAPEGGSAAASAMNSPTLTSHGTKMGIIVGTAAYMAPEQARGKDVGRRADIWAFGVVLYEMLTGRQAFKGDDISEVLATVLKTDPDWTALPPDIPAPVRRLLRRCLEKDPRKRLSAIGDARLELDEQEPAAGAAADPRQPPRRGSIRMSVAVALVGFAILATAGVAYFWVRPAAGAGAAATGTMHLSIVLPDGYELGFTDKAPLAISPDGRRVAYVADSLGQTQLHVRAIADLESKPLTGTEGASSPFFSPDGEWIAFFAGGSLKKVAVGGTSVQVVTAAPDARGGTWATDGQIYFAPSIISGIWKVPAAGGTAVEVTRMDRAHGEISHRWPHVLPDGRTLLFTIWTGPGPDERQIVAQSVAGDNRRVLVRGGDSARYISAGYLIYARLDDLFAVSWRPADAQVGGAAPIKLSEHPRLENEGAAAYDISANGTLVCLTGGAARYAQRIVWIDRAGKTEPLPLPERDFESVWLSPDNRKALVQIREGAMGLWLYDVARQTLTPVATAGGSSQAGNWTPDGARIIYRGTRNGTRNIYWRAADGTGDEQRLTTGEGSQTPTSVSPDGRRLVFHEIGGNSGAGTIMALPLNGAIPATPQILVTGGAQDGHLSPDGRWLAYTLPESSAFEVYVQPFPGPGPRTRISRDGGHDALWSRDGRELFYVTGDRLLGVDVSTSPVFSAGVPRLVVHGRYRPAPNGKTPFDIAPDGRFLRIQQVQPDRPLTRIDVALNWRP